MIFFLIMFTWIFLQYRYFGIKLRLPIAIVIKVLLQTHIHGYIYRLYHTVRLQVTY